MKRISIRNCHQHEILRFICDYNDFWIANGMKFAQRLVCKHFDWKLPFCIGIANAFELSSLSSNWIGCFQLTYTVSLSDSDFNFRVPLLFTISICQQAIQLNLFRHTIKLNCIQNKQFYFDHLFDSVRLHMLMHQCFSQIVVLFAFRLWKFLFLLKLLRKAHTYTEWNNCARNFYEIWDDFRRFHFACKRRV